MPETNNYAARLESLKGSIDRARTDRAKAEATKEQLEKQQEAILSEIRALGVEPDQLDTVITELETGIEADLGKLDELIPQEYRVRG